MIAYDETNTISVDLRIDQQLEDILVTASNLYSQIDALIESGKFKQYTGKSLEEIAEDIGDIIYYLGDYIGFDTATQAFDFCRKKKALSVIKEDK